MEVASGVVTRTISWEERQSRITSYNVCYTKLLRAEGNGGLSEGGEFAPGEYIVKPSRVHASKGIDAGSVVRCATPEDAARAALEAATRHGRPCFAEKYVAGREFSVSLLAGSAHAPEVMPLAEMLFLGNWERPILTYDAKWNPECT